MNKSPLCPESRNTEHATNLQPCPRPLPIPHSAIRNPHYSPLRTGFTLVELLVVVAIIALLAALLLPALVKGKARAQRAECIANLKELGAGFQMFAHDHHGKFPAEVSISDGGSMEFVQAGENVGGPFYFSYRQFQPLAGDVVVPKLLLCPSDIERQPSATFNLLQNSNISYFVGVSADYNIPESILAGDRNITNNANATASLVTGALGLRWTRELHYFKGNLLFADAHVEQVNNVFLDKMAGAQGATFFLPAVLPSMPGSSSPGNGNAAAGPSSWGGGQPPPTPPPASAGNGGSNAAPPPSPPPSSSMQIAMTGSHMAGQPDAPNAFTGTDARETNAGAVKSRMWPTAAPAADDEDQPPLVWLMGAVRVLYAKTSWWFLLLLFLLLGVTLYLYVKRKVREQQRKRR